MPDARRDRDEESMKRIRNDMPVGPAVSVVVAMPAPKPQPEVPART
jgi:hypothetical protein